MPPKKAAAAKKVVKSENVVVKEDTTAPPTPAATTAKTTKNQKKPITKAEPANTPTPQPTPPPAPQQKPQPPQLTVDDILKQVLKHIAIKRCNDCTALPTLAQTRTILVDLADQIPDKALRMQLLDNVAIYTEYYREQYLLHYAQLPIQPFHHTVSNKTKSSRDLQDLAYGTSSIFAKNSINYQNYVKLLMKEASVGMIPTDTAVLNKLKQNNALKQQYMASFTAKFKDTLSLILVTQPFTFDVAQRIEVAEAQIELAYDFVVKYIPYQPDLAQLTTFSTVIFAKISSYIDLLTVEGTPNTYIILSKALTMLCLLTQPQNVPDGENMDKMTISSAQHTKYNQFMTKLQQDPSLISFSPPRGLEWFHAFFAQYKYTATLTQTDKLKDDDANNNNNNNKNANPMNSDGEMTQHLTNIFQLTKFRVNLSLLYVEVLLLWSGVILVPNTLYLSAQSSAAIVTKQDGNAENHQPTQPRLQNEDRQLLSLRYEHFTLLNKKDYLTLSDSMRTSPQLLLALAPYMVYLISILTPQLQPQIYLNNLLIVKLIFILSQFNYLSTALQYYTLTYQQITTMQTQQSASVVKHYHPFLPTNMAEVLQMVKTSVIALGKTYQFTTQHNAKCLLPPEFQQLCSYRIRAQLKHNAAYHRKRAKEHRQENAEIRAEQLAGGLLFRDIEQHMVTLKELFGSKILLQPFVSHGKAAAHLTPLQQSILHELLLVYIKKHADLQVKYQRGEVKDRKDFQLLTHQERLKYTLMGSTLRHQSKWITSMSTGNTAAENIAGLLGLKTNDNSALSGMLHYLLEDNTAAIEEAQREEKKKLAEKNRKRKQKSELRAQDVKNLLSDKQQGDLMTESTLVPRSFLDKGEDDLFVTRGAGTGGGGDEYGEENGDNNELVASLDNEQLFVVKSDTNVFKKYGMAADSTDEEDGGESSEDEAGGAALGGGDDEEEVATKKNKKIKSEADLLDLMQEVTQDLAEYNQYDVNDDELMGIDVQTGFVAEDDDDFGDIAIQGDDSEEEEEQEQDDDIDNYMTDTKTTTFAQNDDDDDDSGSDLDAYMSDKTTTTTTNNNNTNKNNKTNMIDADFGNITILAAADSSDDEETDEESIAEHFVAQKQGKKAQQLLFDQVETIFTAETSDSDDDEQQPQQQMNDSDDDEDEKEKEQQKQQEKLRKEKQAVEKKKAAAKQLLAQQEKRSEEFNDDLTAILAQTGQVEKKAAAGKKVVAKKAAVSVGAKKKAAAAPAEVVVEAPKEQPQQEEQEETIKKSTTTTKKTATTTTTKKTVQAKKPAAKSKK